MLSCLKKGKFLEEDGGDELEIDKDKKELESLRKNGDKGSLAIKEKEITNKIIHTLYTKYPYQKTENHYGYEPNNILKYKELQCVGFSSMTCFFKGIMNKT